MSEAPSDGNRLQVMTVVAPTVLETPSVHSFERFLLLGFAFHWWSISAIHSEEVDEELKLVLPVPQILAVVRWRVTWLRADTEIERLVVPEVLEPWEAPILLEPFQDMVAVIDLSTYSLFEIQEIPEIEPVKLPAAVAERAEVEPHTAEAIPSSRWQGFLHRFQRKSWG